jgi:hypothetical protein
MVLAHILGIPVEEFLIPWTGGGLGAAVLMVLGSNIGRLTSLRIRIFRLR